MSFIQYIKNSILVKNYVITDITVILCVRLTKNNLWIIKRLHMLSSWFLPCPNILIVDYGTSDPYCKKLSDICIQNGYDYHYIDNKTIFSLSNARNEGFLHSTTDLLFFTDPDCIFDRNIFADLLKLANAIKLSNNTFQRVAIPTYYLTKNATELFDSIKTNNEKESQIFYWAYHGVYSENNLIFENISPYSNNFLCHRDYYNLVGGYSSKFLGHGSEDFEFMVRANLLQEKMPIPRNISSDIYRPGLLSSEKKSYIGFRRLAEVEAFSGELHGLRSFHLWHPRVASKGWYENSDISRKIFKGILSNYIHQKINLLTEDYLPRKKHALAIISNESHLAFFLPLRVLGYSFDVLFETSQINIILKNIDSDIYQRVFIYNPYAENIFGKVIDSIYKSKVIPITVIERGALPNSIYYATDMSYRDPDFINLSIGDLKRFAENHKIKIDKRLLKILKSGSATLESNAEYQATLDQLNGEIDSTKELIIFIPLQLPYDTAVTLFNNGYPTYSEFLNSVRLSVAKYPNVKFIIKPHPLLKAEHYPDVLKIKADNLIILKNNENVHAIIEKVTAVVLYNSGVGLLSLLHNKCLFHIGNAYYTVNQHFATKVDDVNQAIEKLYLERLPSYSKDDVHLFLFWLVNYKYSFFDAIDEYRELEHRKSHNYQNIQVALFNYKGKSYHFGSLDSKLNYSSNSYAAVKLGLNSKDDHRKYIQNIKKNISLMRLLGVKCFIVFTFPYLTTYDKKLLKNNPKLFFRTAKHPFSVWIGKKLKLR